MRYLQRVPQTEKLKTDAKDRKILGLLSANARMPLTQLAKNVGLSRDAVKYRVTNYEKRGIIQGYRTLVDISKFGYDNYHLFIKLNNPSKDVEQGILAKLTKHPFVRAILKFSGDYDFEVAFVAKGVAELDKKLTIMITDCAGSLQDYEIMTIVKTYAAETFPPDFLEMKGNYVKKVKKEMQPDEKDIEILKVVAEDAQLPLFHIGNKVGLSADAVSYRLKNMLDSGVIVKFIPVINYVSLGYNLYTILLNMSALDEEREMRLKGFLLSDKNILWAVKTIGRFNVLIYVLVKDIDSLQDTLLSLRSLFPKQINHYETLIAYEEYKYVYFPSDLF
ncbi:Lrp/AsnC family transcriptional regulator [Thermoproteota archaeon]